MLVEVDTSIRGLAEFLLAMAKCNLVDAARDDRVFAELVRRCTVAGGVGWRYQLDRGPDRWTTFVPLLERTEPEDPIVADCEDQTASYAAAIALVQPERIVEVAITQPRPGAMAHAYVFLDDSVFDPSVFNGMKKPKPSFYGSGETVRLRVR